MTDYDFSDWVAAAEADYDDALADGDRAKAERIKADHAAQHARFARRYRSAS